MVPLVVRLCKETESAVRGINFGVLSAKNLLCKIKCTMRMLKLIKICFSLKPPLELIKWVHMFKKVVQIRPRWTYFH